ncbi:putative prefoldin subunit [Clavispora lusitaniae]|uniref:Prefoldin subunit 4 n=1 Tax=Clavispora lusitaniae TaxID=36911 RepID=A0AA91PVM5_CLALS|nr:putative prefoldin subunit [Clavispora lusitaniae]
MELLPSGQKNTTEVLWEDQQKINKFSSLINRKDALSEQLQKLKTEKEYVDDLALEIELLDESDKIQYKVGDVFVFLSVTEAVENIEKENESLDTKVEQLSDEIDEIDQQLAQLKAHLYGKFGQNINLER